MSTPHEAIPEVKDGVENVTRDTGSVRAQCTGITKRITLLTTYIKTYKKDVPAKRALLRLVAQRKRLLQYLKRKNGDAYISLIGDLRLKA